MSILLLFSVALLINYFSKKYLSSYYALDIPDFRKKHLKPSSQIGGIIFATIFSFIIYFFIEGTPIWLVIGSVASLALGALDDNYDLNWKSKLIFQVLLAIFITYIFWGRFTHFSFYGYEVAASQSMFFGIFIIWFVGIYNSVNLIDGLDGLASGAVAIMCFSLMFLSDGLFSEINLILGILLTVFLIFNQRPAKFFMGDAGSLFLGFFVSIQILLYHDLVIPNAKVLNVTPFSIIISFLVADTTRVFLTRILSGNNPMNADTIHLHHLVIQKSGSYLATLLVIFGFVMISSLFAIISFYNTFDNQALIIHLSLLFLFILTPPAPTYVNLISKITGTSYAWQKDSPQDKPKLNRTLFVFLFYLIVLVSLILKLNYSFNWQFILSLILLSLFIFIYNKDKIFITALQVYQTIFLFTFFWAVPLSNHIILFDILLIILLATFTLDRLYGVEINNYSALDIAIVLVTIGAIVLSFLKIISHGWLFLTICILWFSLSFILRRLLFEKIKYEN